MIEYDNDQFMLISDIVKVLDIFEINNNIAPFNTKPMLLSEYAPYDLELEEECFMSSTCIFKTIPSICPKNHQGLPTIKKNYYLPSLLCKYERPWRTCNNKPIKCNNINCWFSHLKGRKNHIRNILLNMGE